jgi:hypothetical protein
VAPEVVNVNREFGSCSRPSADYHKACLAEGGFAALLLAIASITAGNSQSDCRCGKCRCRRENADLARREMAAIEYHIASSASTSATRLRTTPTVRTPHNLGSRLADGARVFEIKQNFDPDARSNG